MNIEDDADILVGYIATALDNKSWDKARAKIVEYLHKYNNEVDNSPILDSGEEFKKWLGSKTLSWALSVSTVQNMETAWNAANCKEIESLQAKIDSLMLEYCPNEMTKDQIDNWEKHQVKSSVKIDGE